MSPLPPFLVTAKLDDAAWQRLDALRQRHFPAELNRVPAHISLFHQLPGFEEVAIVRGLREVCARTSPAAFRVSGPRSLGRGVALAVEAPGLVEARAMLAARWSGWLTPQDRQPFRPHVTIQNKVTAQAARRLLDDLQRSAMPEAGTIEGLQLWRYLNGPWEAVSVFGFGMSG